MDAIVAWFLVVFVILQYVKTDALKFLQEIDGVVLSM